MAREQMVPGEEGRAGRWSLDHLFVDQDGVPTLVEVKRASDTRGRREVVAQMLDYAANGVVYAIKKLPPFDQDGTRQDIVAALTRTTDLVFSDRAFEGEPSIPLTLLRAPQRRDGVFAVWQSLMDRIRGDA